MKKLIDISDDYLDGLKSLSEFYKRSVKKQMETIIHDELHEVLSKNHPDIVKSRNEVIDSIYKVFEGNGDSDKELKFVCFCDHIAQYKLNTKDHVYIIDVDNETILPKTKIGHIIYHNSHSETYIDFTCKSKKTGEETCLDHSGHILAYDKLENKGLIRE